MATDAGSDRQIARDETGVRYFRNAVERHWDPHDIELGADRDRFVEFLEDVDNPAPYLDMHRTSVARFGAGEQAVTEDLAPLAVALEDIEDEMFVTTQLYEEAKHTDFFDRYWREVVDEVAGAVGLEQVAPTADRWFNDAYDDLFDRNERAMAAVLDDDSPETVATAYCHYHLVIEGILAQTGYYGLQRSFSGDHHPELPHLPGLYEGFTHIRQDEGRHVGFGMSKLKELVTSGSVDAQFLDDTVQELMPLVTEIATIDAGPNRADIGVSPEELRRFASEKHVERMRQITSAEEAIPSVETLVRLDDVDS